jgi:hypothetical protein
LRDNLQAGPDRWHSNLISRIPFLSFEEAT